jgi:hypothetical protein
MHDPVREGAPMLQRLITRLIADLRAWWKHERGQCFVGTDRLD